MLRLLCVPLARRGEWEIYTSSQNTTPPSALISDHPAQGNIRSGVFLEGAAVSSGFSFPPPPNTPELLVTLLV